MRSLIVGSHASDAKKPLKDRSSEALTSHWPASEASLSVSQSELDAFPNPALSSIPYATLAQSVKLQSPELFVTDVDPSCLDRLQQRGPPKKSLFKLEAPAFEGIVNFVLLFADIESWKC